MSEPIVCWESKIAKTSQWKVVNVFSTAMVTTDLEPNLQRKFRRTSLTSDAKILECFFSEWAWGEHFKKLQLCSQFVCFWTFRFHSVFCNYRYKTFSCPLKQVLDWMQLRVKCFKPINKGFFFLIFFNCSFGLIISSWHCKIISVVITYQISNRTLMQLIMLQYLFSSKYMACTWILELQSLAFGALLHY